MKTGQNRSVFGWTNDIQKQLWLLLVCEFLCVGILKILFQVTLLVYMLYPKLLTRRRHESGRNRS